MISRLIKKIESAIRREIGKSQPALSFLRDVWQFIQRVEAVGIKINDPNPPPDVDVMLDDFAYSLAKTVTRMTSTPPGEESLLTTVDGVVLLIDEADNASPEIGLGTFVKLLLERLQRHGCDRVMVAMAGLPRLRRILTDSHPSSLRLFDELELDRLSRSDVEDVINRGLHVANDMNTQQTQIDSKARELLILFTEGYPHFIQQFAFSAFAVDTDDLIDEKDVMLSALGDHGALEQIGNRYFRDDFYQKIRKESYRQVLRIMAGKLDRWITKSEIRTQFTGNDSTLDNAISALRRRHIIISKEGERGVYRLRHQAFAFWINTYARIKSAQS